MCRHQQLLTIIDRVGKHTREIRLGIWMQTHLRLFDQNHAVLRRGKDLYEHWQDLSRSKTRGLDSQRCMKGRVQVSSVQKLLTHPAAGQRTQPEDLCPMLNLTRLSRIPGMREDQ